MSATDGLSSCIHCLRLATVLSIAAINFDFFGFSLAHSSCRNCTPASYSSSSSAVTTTWFFRLDGVLSGGSSFSLSSSLERLRLTVFGGALRFLNFLRICCFHDPYKYNIEKHYVQYAYPHSHVHTTHLHIHSHTNLSKLGTFGLAVCRQLCSPLCLDIHNPGTKAHRWR